MRPRVLVVTTVHPPDDPRIRSKLIGSLAPRWEVAYACRPPGPSSVEGLVWLPLPGGRMMRDLRAARAMLTSPVDVISVHDPELIPAAVLARLVRRVRVVIDVHENVPVQIMTKAWVPAALRRPLAWAARMMLRLGEALADVTLAEEGYRSLFRRAHPVFPNFPRFDGQPGDRSGPGDGSVVYVGDVTPARVGTALDAWPRMEDPPRLTLIGRVAPEIRHRLRHLPAGLTIETTGYLPHPEAMERVAAASLGLAPLSDLPNYRHSLPTKVMEYLALGLPVVASDLPGTRAVIGGLPGTRLVPPDDPNAWAAAVLDALRSPELSAAARDGAGEVRQRFAWPDDQVEDYYAGLVG